MDRIQNDHIVSIGQTKAVVLLLWVWALGWFPISAIGQTIEIGTSPNPVGSGARAMGQGNAFIAIADDATAASWNPGGLPQLQKPEISFALDAICRREAIASNLHPESKSTDAVDVADFNYASVVQPYFYRKNMVFSLSFLRLYDFDKAMRFPFNTPRRQSQFDFDQEGAFAVVAPAYGIELTDQLSLGITANVWNHSVTQASRYEQTTDERGVLTKPSGLQSNFANRIEESFAVDRGYSIVIGGLYRPSKEFTLGAVLKPSHRLRLDHRHQDQFFQADITTGFIERNDLLRTRNSVELRFPWIFGAGVAWRPTDRWTVSTDATWTQWSEYQFEENGVTTNPLTNTSAAADQLDDTVTIRLGSEYLLLLKSIIVPLRGGCGYDPGPAVNDVDEFYTVSLGTGLQAGPVMFDIAWEFRWGNHVNSDILRGLGDGEQTVRQYRVLASMIYYF